MKTGKLVGNIVGAKHIKGFVSDMNPVARSILRPFIVFARFVNACGTYPGVFILWPLVVFLVSLCPDWIKGPIGDGASWLVIEVFLFGHGLEYPRTALFMALLLPTFAVLYASIIIAVPYFIIEACKDAIRRVKAW